MLYPYFIPAAGVTLRKNKAMTQDLPIRDCPAPQKIVLPVWQHLGAAATVVVRPGDRVRAGQLIGQAQDGVSAHVHTPLAGLVEELAEITLPDLRTSPAVIIARADAEPAPPGPAGVDPESFSPSQILEKIAQAGVVGMGGAMFPTQLKLKPPADKKIDSVVINAAECEPYLNSDYRLLLEQMGRVLEGAAILKRCLGEVGVYLGIEAERVPALRQRQGHTQFETKMTVAALPDPYPQGDETLLVRTVLGRIIPGPGLPWDVGVVVLNVSTVLAIRAAVIENQPLIDRVVTVAGRGVREPANLRVPIGTRLQDVLDACGGLSAETQRIVAGGPMMGWYVNDLDLPVGKGTTGVLALTKEEIRAEAEEKPCIRCGRCTEACPYQLQPWILYRAWKRGRSKKAENHHLRYCVECGCCDYVCPARIPLASTFRRAKQALRRPRS